MIAKILNKDIGKVNLSLAFVGILIGFTLLICGLQFYNDITNLTSANKNLIKSDFLVINKNVNPLDPKGSTFSEAEINDLRAQNFVRKISPFNSNSFEMTAFTKKSMLMPAMYTDLFFESIPDEYLDIKSDEWKWTPGDTIIPIAIPTDYLNLYNFGYAISQGLPQINEKIVNTVLFNVNIGKQEVKATYSGKIVGFTDRLNSILVPESFLKFANEKYGNSPSKSPSRLLLEAKDPSSPDLAKYLLEKNYRTNKEKLKNSKLNTLLSISLSFVWIVSLIIIILAVMLFILSFQLMVAKSEYKLETLRLLGYSIKAISMYYISRFIVIVGIVNICAFTTLLILKTFYTSYMKSFGFEVLSTIDISTITVALLISAVVILINSLLIHYKIKKLI
jgi:hypothetical protein